MDKIEIRTLDKVETTGFFRLLSPVVEGATTPAAVRRAATETHPTAGRRTAGTRGAIPGAIPRATRPKWCVAQPQHNDLELLRPPQVSPRTRSSTGT
jgi:hypothetical protein